MIEYRGFKPCEHGMIEDSAHAYVASAEAKADRDAVEAAGYVHAGQVDRLPPLTPEEEKARNYGLLFLGKSLAVYDNSAAAEFDARWRESPWYG